VLVSKEAQSRCHSAENCVKVDNGAGQKFSVLKYRHRCSSCGHVFCKSCCANTFVLLRSTMPMLCADEVSEHSNSSASTTTKVCDSCFQRVGAYNELASVKMIPNARRLFDFYMQ
jgi:hypothetical protein